MNWRGMIGDRYHGIQPLSIIMMIGWEDLTEWLDLFRLKILEGMSEKDPRPEIMSFKNKGTI